MVNFLITRQTVVYAVLEFDAHQISKDSVLYATDQRIFQQYGLLNHMIIPSQFGGQSLQCPLQLDDTANHTDPIY
jgi:hypothetical protein